MKNVRVIGLLTLCFLLGLFTVATISGCSEKKDGTGDIQQEATDENDPVVHGNRMFLIPDLPEVQEPAGSDQTGQTSRGHLFARVLQKEEDQCRMKWSVQVWNPLLQCGLHPYEDMKRVRQLHQQAKCV